MFVRRVGWRVCLFCKLNFIAVCLILSACCVIQCTNTSNLPVCASFTFFRLSPHKVPALGSDPVHYDDLYAPPMVFFLFVFWLRRLLAATSKFARLFAAPN